jgi:hypothetical protein
MSEELYGVSVGRNQNYNGRDRHGNLLWAPHGGGVFMNLETARALCNVLLPKYPSVRPVVLLRGDRDEAAFTSLIELGEAIGLDKLAMVIQQCVNQGFSGEEILLKCKNLVDAAGASVAKQNRIRELEEEAAHLRAT